MSRASIPKLWARPLRGVERDVAVCSSSGARGFAIVTTKESTVVKSMPSPEFLMDSCIREETSLALAENSQKGIILTYKFQGAPVIRYSIQNRHPKSLLYLAYRKARLRIAEGGHLKISFSQETNSLKQSYVCQIKSI